MRVSEEGGDAFKIGALFLSFDIFLRSVRCVET